MWMSVYSRKPKKITSWMAGKMMLFLVSLADAIVINAARTVG